MEVNSEIQIDTEPVLSTACPKCGAVVNVADRKPFSDITCAACRFEFVVPAQFGPFLLLQVLGMGGMGGVYRARDEALNREVAIKVMQKRLGSDPSFIENFQREAQAAAKLNHPNIAQIYSFGQALGQPYIVMELLSGGSLDRMMAEQGPLDPAVVFHVGLQIAEGLREAAEAGLVHGDVKPENILFDNDKNAKLLDFGLAAINSSQSAEIWGTPFYIPPEKVKKQPADFRSDIYSLGATLYHAIAGVPPFDGTDITAVVKARFIADPIPLRDLRGSVVPEEVDDIILRMMAREPSQRFPTYGSLLSDIRRYLSKAGPVNLAVSGRKIMIKAKRPKTPTAEIDQQANQAAPPRKEKPRLIFSKREKEESVPLEKPEEAPTESDAQKRKFWKMVCLLAAGVVVAISLIVVSIMLVIAQIGANQKKLENASIVKRQEVAKASIVKAMTEARKFVNYIKESEPQALKYANEAKEAVVAVMGEEASSRLPPPAPEYTVPTFGEDEEQPPVQAVTNAPLAVTNAPLAIKNAPQAVTNVSQAVTNASLTATNAIPAVTNASLVATNAISAITNVMQVVLKDDKDKSGGKKKFRAPVFADVGDEESNKKYPVIKTVRGMYMEAYRVKYALLLANAMLAEIEKMSLRAEKLTAPEKVKDMQNVANSLVEKVKTMGYTKELTDVARNVSGLKKTLDSVRVDVASLVAIKHQEEIEKVKIQKREAEEAAKRKEAEDLALKIKADCNKIADVEASNIALLKALRFRDATRNLSLISSELSTQGGQEALEISKERVRRVEEVIKHIIGKAQGYKSPKGWVIEEADMKTLTVNSKKIAWADIFNTRMEIVNELFNALIFNSELTKAMRMRERTRLEVGAALCLWMYYRDVPTAVERAKQIATKATQAFEADAELTKQLMPGVVD
ncbi:MAG: serine/threonine-protein kinase [bacterium]